MDIICIEIAAELNCCWDFYGACVRKKNTAYGKHIRCAFHDFFDRSNRKAAGMRICDLLHGCYFVGVKRAIRFLAL